MRHGLLALVLAGCLPEYEQIQGDHLLYEHSEDLHLCAGTVPYMDRLIPFLEAQLALTAPKRIRYSWIPDGSQVTVAAHAQGSDPTNVHELTHAVTGGMLARFFTEGVAVAMESTGESIRPRYPYSDADLAEPIWDPYETMTAVDDGSVNYATAGAFVAFLLVRHGPARFYEFYRGLGGPATMSWLRGQFRRAYEVDLDAEIELFRRKIPTCEADAYPLAQPECSGARVEWASQSLWEHEVSLACDDAGVIGGIGPDRVWSSFYPATLKVETRGYYTLSLDNASVSARFGPCFGCPWDGRDIFLDRGTSQMTALLDPGIYYLRLNSMSDESHDVLVQLKLQ